MSVTCVANVTEKLPLVFSVQLEQGKRDSGTCDHLETDQDGVVVTDASTNTLVSGEVGYLIIVSHSSVILRLIDNN